MKINPLLPYQQRNDHTLLKLMDDAGIPATRIREAMVYALFPGGKRLRPLLIYLCGELLNIAIDSLDIMAAAIELIHCYSLIHDDLPAMDNDDFRRGKPSTHRAFDEATAILVGDGMQALAIEVLLMYLPKTLSATQVVNITLALTKACGPSGMVSGQSLDLSELMNPQISLEKLSHIHQLKTGQLIQSCVHMALHAGQPTAQESSALTRFASHLGLVFQMQDDYLDRYDEHTHVGKDRSSDTINQKTTFATPYAKEDLLDLITYHFQQAYASLDAFGKRATSLKYLLSDIESRSKMNFIDENHIHQFNDQINC